MPSLFQRGGEGGGANSFYMDNHHLFSWNGPNTPVCSYILDCTYIQIIAEPARDDKEARQTPTPGPWVSHRTPIDCGGYSCALVANSGSNKNSRPPPPTRVVRRETGGQ